MDAIIVSFIIAFIPALIARRKGRSFFSWYVYGVLLFIVALIHSLLIKANKAKVENLQIAPGMKKCPFCAEFIKTEAIKCKHCKSDLTEKQNDMRDFSGDLPESFLIENNGIMSLDNSMIREYALYLKSKFPGYSASFIFLSNSPSIDKMVNDMPLNLKNDFRKILQDELSHL